MRRRTEAKPSFLLWLAVVFCFFATGLAGLIYEILWNRMLTLRMGNTSYALAALLTVFMGGLALGAWIAGRWAPRGRWAIRTYGILELTLGLYCLVLPKLLDAVNPWFDWIYRQYYDSLLTFSLLQFAVVGLLLLIPTTMMGATLPILVGYLTTRLGTLGKTVGLLYAVNAGGAFVGAMLAGVYLLPRYGVHHSYLVAVAANVIVGVFVLGISWRISPRVGLSSVPAPPPNSRRSRVKSRGQTVTTQAPSAHFNRPVLLVGFGLSGLAAMVYQVAWTRALTLPMGSSTYAFTLIAGAFILGLALGSVLLGWIGDRPWGRYAIGLLPVLIGLLALLTIGQIGTLPIRMVRLLDRATDFHALEWDRLKLILMIFLPSTFCMGGLLPVVCRFVARGYEDAPSAVGSAYAANAIGTILGSFCAGFLLIPWVGMRWSILIGAAVSMAVGIVFFLQVLRGGWASRLTCVVVIPAVGVVAIAVTPAWNPSVITSGPFIETKGRGPDGFATDEEIRRRMAKNILYYKEGVASTVTVAGYESTGQRVMYINGMANAYSNGSTYIWLGHLPMFLRPDARRVLVVGLGGGNTLASVQCDPSVMTIDCVEISADVVQAARDYFSESTNDALDDSRTEIILGDGRTHLEHTDRRYDVIISQPLNPWLAGASSLFTQECLEAMRRCLNPDGLACIWFQGFKMPVENFQILCQTWAKAWAHPSIWITSQHGEFVFVGSQSPLVIDYDKLHARFYSRAVVSDMRRIAILMPSDMLGYMITAGDKVAALAGDAPLNTDDNSRIEYDTPRGMWKDQAIEILRRLFAHRVDPWDFVAPATSRGYLANKNRSEVMLENREKIARALSLPVSLRQAIYKDVLKLNPFNPIAASESRRFAGP